MCHSNRENIGWLNVDAEFQPRRAIGIPILGSLGRLTFRITGRVRKVKVHVEVKRMLAWYNVRCSLLEDQYSKETIL
jgi:hypothetical protein